MDVRRPEVACDTYEYVYSSGVAGGSNGRTRTRMEEFQKKNPRPLFIIIFRPDIWPKNDDEKWSRIFFLKFLHARARASIRAARHAAAVDVLVRVTRDLRTADVHGVDEPFEASPSLSPLSHARPIFISI